MQIQELNPTLNTLNLVEEKLKELGAVKSVNELKEALQNQVSHQVIKVCLAYLEGKNVVVSSISGGIAYTTPKNLSNLKSKGLTL